MAFDPSKYGATKVDDTVSSAFDPKKYGATVVEAAPSQKKNDGGTSLPTPTTPSTGNTSEKSPLKPERIDWDIAKFKKAASDKLDEITAGVKLLGSDIADGLVAIRNAPGKLVRQHQEAKVSEIYDNALKGKADESDLAYMSEAAPKVFADLYKQFRPEAATEYQQWGSNAKGQSLARIIKQKADEVFPVLQAEAGVQQKEKLLADFDKQYITKQQLASPQFREDYLNTVNRREQDEIARLNAEYPEQEMIQDVGGAMQSVKYRNNQAEYDKKLAAVKQAAQTKRNRVGDAAAMIYAEANPNATPMEVGYEKMQYADPDRYSSLKEAGRSAAHKEVEQMGIQALRTNGNIASAQLAYKDEQELESKYPEQKINEVYHLIGAELNKNSSGLFNAAPSIAEMDEAAKQLKAEDRAVYFKHIRPRERKIVGTDVPMTGVANKIGEGFVQSVENLGAGIERIASKRDDRKDAIELLNQPYETRFANVGDSEPVKQELSMYKQVIKAGNDLKPEEYVRMRELEALTENRGAGQKFLDSAGNIGGQVIAMATGTRAFAGLLTKAATALGAGGKLAAETGAWALGGARAANAVSSAATTGAASMLVPATVMTGYMMAYDDEAKDALRRFPNEKDAAKRQLMTEWGSMVNGVSELIFRDTKVLDAFNKSIKPGLARIATQLTEKELSVAAARAEISKVMEGAGNFGKFLVRSGINANQEALEEAVVPILKEMAMGVLEPSKMNMHEAFQQATESYKTMLVDGLPVAMFASIKAPKSARVQAPLLANIGRSATYTNNLINEIRRLQADGSLSEQDAQAKLNIIGDLKKANDEILPEIKQDIADGKLTGQQVDKLVIMAANEAALQRKADGIKDPVIKKRVEEQIKASQDARAKILNKEVFVNEDYSIQTPEEIADEAKPADKKDTEKDDAQVEEEVPETVPLTPIEVPAQEAVVPSETPVANEEVIETENASPVEAGAEVVDNTPVQETAAVETVVDSPEQLEAAPPTAPAPKKKKRKKNDTAATTPTEEPVQPDAATTEQPVVETAAPESVVETGQADAAPATTVLEDPAAETASVTTDAAPKKVRFRFDDGKMRTGTVESVDKGTYRIKDNKGFTYTVKESAIYEKDGVKVKEDDEENYSRTSTGVPEEFAAGTGKAGRIEPEPIAGKKPKQLSKIIFDAAKSTASRIYYGKPAARRAAGTYSPGNTAIKIKFANDLDTTAHELGHSIDDLFGILSDLEANPNPDVERELKRFADEGGSAPPKGHANPQKYTNAEGMAEFIRGLIVNPGETRRRAHALSALFDSKVDDEYKKALEQFSEDVRTWYGATGRDMVMANIEWDAPKKKGWLAELFSRSKENGNEFFVSFGDRIRANIVNPLHLFNEAVKYLQGIQGIDELLPANDPELLARALLHVGAKVDSIFVDGMIDGNLKRIKDKDGKVKNLDWLLEPLDKTTAGTLEEELKDTAAYMISERTIELADRFGRTNLLSGIGGGMVSDVAVAKKNMEQFDNYPADKQARIKEAAKRYREFADHTMQYMVDKGRMAKDEYDSEGNLIGGYDFIKQNNLQYVAMNRVLETEPGQPIQPFATGGGNNLGSKTEVVKKIKGSSATIQNPYTSLLDATNKAIRESDRNEVMQAFRDLMVSEREMYDGDVKRLADIGVKLKQGDKNTIPIFVDGKAEYWRFQEDIYKVLKGLTEVYKLPGFITALPRLLRWTVTHSPIFAARNIVRDTQDRLIKSNENSWRNAFGLSDFVGDKKHWKEVAVAGGLNSGFYMKDRVHYNGLLTEAIDRVAKKPNTVVINPAKLAANAWKGYEAMLQKGETLNRVTEYRAAFRKAKEQGMDDYNAMLYAGNKSADLLDFALAGHWMKILNQIVPFSNAAVQGLRSTVAHAKENPKGFAARLAIQTIVPQMIMWLLAHRDDETAKEYEDMPDYQRDMFWNFKVGANTWVSIPKAYELGIMSAGIDRLMSQASGANENAFGGYAGSVRKSMIPLDEAAMTGPFKTAVENMTNYDFFREKHIIPPYEEGLNLEMRKTERASRMGKALSAAFGVDPRFTDHTIKGMTSYLGNYAIKASNIGRADGEHFSIKDLGFFKDSPAYNSKSVQKLMDVIKEFGLGSTKEAKEFRRLAEEAMDAKTDAEKEKAAKVVRDYSASILAEMREKGDAKLKKKVAEE